MRFRLLASIGLTGLGLLSCSTDDGNLFTGSGAATSSGSGGAGGDGHVCTPGAQVNCGCPGGTVGVQVCSESGKSLGQCHCGASGSGGTGGDGGMSVASSSESSSASSSSESASSASESASSAASSSSAGTVMVCTPGDTLDCYDGPTGTEGKGLCKGGKKTCNSQGTSYGACSGEVLPLPVDLCSTTGDDDCDGSNMPCLDDSLWTKAWNQEIDPVITVAPSGNITMTGSIDDTIDFGAGAFSPPGPGRSALVVTFDKTGKELWHKAWGNSISRGQAIASDTAGNVYVAGTLWSTTDFGGGQVGVDGSVSYFLVKLDAAGNYLWSKVVPGVSGIETIAVDSVGNVLVGGGASGTIDFGAGPLPHHSTADAFLVKLDSSGNMLWGKEFGAQNNGTSYAPTQSIVATDDGDVAIVMANHGEDLGSGSYAGEKLLLRFHGDGSMVAANGLLTGGTAIDTLTTDGVGGVFMCGSFFNHLAIGAGSELAPYGGFGARFKSSGTSEAVLWQTTYLAPTSFAIPLFHSGTLLEAGRFSGTADFGDGPRSSLSGGGDALLVKLDTAGTVLKVKTFGNPASPQGFTSAGWSPGGALVVAGDLLGTLDLGNGAAPVTAPGIGANSGTFLAKLPF